MPLSISEYRDTARVWLEWVAAQRSEQDPVYRRVTENRDDGKPHGYSSCGDLAHAMLWELGVRLGWVNHGLQYKVGRNVSSLAWSVCTNTPTVLELIDHPLECGDIGIVWARPDTKDAHVIVTLDYEPRTGQWWTAEYGQPGGRTRSDRRLSDLVLRDDGRKLQRVVRLEKVLETAALLGALQAIDGPGMLAAWGARGARGARVP